MIHPEIEPGGVYEGMVGRARLVISMDPDTDKVTYRHRGQAKILDCDFRTFRQWAIRDVTEDPKKADSWGVDGSRRRGRVSNLPCTGNNLQTA